MFHNLIKLFHSTAKNVFKIVFNQIGRFSKTHCLSNNEKPSAKINSLYAEHALKLENHDGTI